jgi:hypothetical protein
MRGARVVWSVAVGIRGKDGCMDGLERGYLPTPYSWKGFVTGAFPVAEPWVGGIVSREAQVG